MKKKNWGLEKLDMHTLYVVNPGQELTSNPELIKLCYCNRMKEWVKKKKWNSQEALQTSLLFWSGWVSLSYNSGVTFANSVNQKKNCWLLHTPESSVSYRPMHILKVLKKNKNPLCIWETLVSCKWDSNNIGKKCRQLQKNCPNKK